MIWIYCSNDFASFIAPLFSTYLKCVVTQCFYTEYSYYVGFLQIWLHMATEVQTHAFLKPGACVEL